MQVGGLFQSPLLLGTPSRYVTLSAEVTLHISVAQGDGRGWGGEESAWSLPDNVDLHQDGGCSLSLPAPAPPPPHRPRRRWASEG